MINDEDSEVREMVAFMGYGLDILVHDKEEKVRKMALLKQKENN